MNLLLYHSLKAVVCKAGIQINTLGKYSSDQIVVICTKDGSKLLLETKGKVFEVEKINDNYFMNASSGYFFEFYPDKGELQIKETDNIYYLERAKQSNR